MQRAALTLVVATYLIVGGLLLLVTLFRDPYLDPYCWDELHDERLRRRIPPVAGASAWSGCSSGARSCRASALAVACTARLAQAIRPGRRRHWEALLGGLALGLATIASCIEHLHHRSRRPTPARRARALRGSGRGDRRHRRRSRVDARGGMAATPRR